MGAPANFDILPAKGSAEAQRLAGRLAAYVDTGAFAASREWSRAHGAGRTLEIGPGLAETTAALRDTGIDIHWMDASTHFAAAAAGVAPGRGIVADAARTAWRDASFDTIIADRVLHHVPGTIAALTELRRIVADGGQLALTLPDTGGQRHDAPAAYNRFLAALCTPGRFTAVPNAAAVVLGDAAACGWAVADVARFTIDDRDVLLEYSQLHTRLAHVDTLDADQRDEVVAWAERDDIWWELDIVGIALTAT